jgi:hypothetical protein
MHKSQRITFHDDNTGQAKEQVFGVFKGGAMKYALLHQGTLQIYFFLLHLTGKLVIPVVLAHGHKIIVLIAHKIRARLSIIAELYAVKMPRFNRRTVTSFFNRKKYRILQRTGLVSGNNLNKIHNLKWLEYAGLLKGMLCVLHIF